MRPLVVLSLFISSLAFSQDIETRVAPFGTLLRVALPTSPFPHADREAGHRYGDRHYPADLHYRDSTVLLFVPKGFRPDRPLDLVVHIHGWYAVVDSVVTKFRLAEQLTASGKNAILVVPQGPRNSPDSFGGRLEDAGQFGRFIDQVGEELFARRLVSAPAVRSVVLTGHSGAYRMISYILLRGGATDRIKEVYTFDALYGQLEKYAHWLTQQRGRFIAVYCDSGGTKATTESLMEDLDGWGVPYAAFEESSPSIDLRRERITFIHSDLGHNEVLGVRDQFRRYLSSGSLENR